MLCGVKEMANGDVDNGKIVNKNEIVNSIERSFKKFAEGLKEVFEDITSLEVNTMVVSEIQGMKFYPEEAYWFIYNIPIDSKASLYQQYRTDYYKEKNITDATVQERHMQLRERLVKISRSLEREIKNTNDTPTPAPYKLPYRLPLPDPLVDSTERENILRIQEQIIQEVKKNPEIDALGSKKADEVRKQTTDVLTQLQEIQQYKDRIKDLQALQEKIAKPEAQNDIQAISIVLRKQIQQLKPDTTLEAQNDIQELYKEIISILQEKIKELQKSDTTSDTKNNIQQIQELQEQISDLLQERVNELPKIIRKKEDTRRTFLLKNSEFLLRLRKLNELRSLLEGEAASQNNIYDLIYAQTVIQIDGDVMNRFDKKLFEPKEKEIREFLLSIHQGSVISGEENWREFLHFMKDLVESIANYFKRQ